MLRTEGGCRSTQDLRQKALAMMRVEEKGYLDQGDTCGVGEKGLNFGKIWLIDRNGKVS